MKKRKYLTEFALLAVSETKLIIPVEQLKYVEDKDAFHIYTILAIEKIRFDSYKCFKNYIEAVFFYMKEGKQNKLNIKIGLHQELDHSNVSIASVFPFDDLKIKIDDDVFLDKFNWKKEFDISSEELFLLFSGNQSEPLKFEVCYIGQAQGKDGSRNAIDRLESHETLQKILADENKKDRRVWVCLFEFTTNLITSHDGVSKEYIMSDLEDQNHAKKVLSDLPIYNQVINITEAAMINYFKPFYNTDYVNNFPNIKHKGYRQYFDLDYNSLRIELGLVFDKLPQVIFYTETNKISSEWEYIEYGLFNDKDRKSMFEIFK